MSVSGHNTIEQEFRSLPFEKKMMSLFRLEAIAVGEAFNVVTREAADLFRRAGETFSSLSARMEQEFSTFTSGASNDDAHGAGDESAEAKGTE